MSDIGFSELVLVAIVALIVIGPEQLPTTIKTVSLWLGRIRRSFQDAKAEIEREIGADDIRAQLHNEAIMKSLEKSKQQLQSSVNDMNKVMTEQINLQDKLQDNLQNNNAPTAKETKE
jgi:sec-independent protein translocase protein TatB